MIIRYIFICLVSISYVSAQKNQKLYVASFSGLSLREEPNKDSKRLDLIPYGTELQNIEIDEYGGGKKL